MIVWLLATFIIVLLGYIYLFVIRSKRRRLPDGAREAPIEKGWPILGILHQIEKPLYHYLFKLSEKHGYLFRIKFGMRNIYVLNDYNILKKCHKDDADNFSGRWNGKLIEVAVKNSGIMMIDGEVWSKHRSFMLKVLRDFGLGKSRTIEIVQDECRHLCLEIENAGNKSLDFSEMIPIYTVNIISKFIMNKRYERGNEDVKFISHMVDNLVKQKDFIQIFHFLFPFWDNSVLLSKITVFIYLRQHKIEHIYNIFRKEIKNHEKGLDLNSEGEDLMDRFLIEQSKIVNKTGSVETFTEFQLVRSSLELFMAGYETTSTTLGWSLLFLSKYQEMQKKMHDEIVEHIGIDQLPSTNDKKALPLTQAIMDEILRLSSVLPLSVFNRNFKDAIIDGIFIEKNSTIFSNWYACHRDARVWKKPFEFYPEHFLVTDNDGALKYSPREELIPFSIGKRQCLGESLARAEYFIFLATIIQRFKVNFANNVSEEDYQKALLGGDGTIRFSNIKHFTFDKYE